MNAGIFDRREIVLLPSPTERDEIMGQSPGQCFQGISNESLASSWIYQEIGGTHSFPWYVIVHEDARYTASLIHKHILRRYLAVSRDPQKNCESVLKIPKAVVEFVGGILKTISSITYQEKDKQGAFVSKNTDDEEIVHDKEIHATFGSIKNEVPKVEEIEPTLKTPISVKCCSPSSYISSNSTDGETCTGTQWVTSKAMVMSVRIFECPRCPATFKGSYRSFQQLLAHARRKHKEYCPGLITELLERYKYSRIKKLGVKICCCSFCKTYGVKRNL